MKNPYEGVLEPDHFRLIARRVRKLGFRGQDADEVIQLTAIRLSRTTIRDEGIVLSAVDESAADVRRRERRHTRRVERLQELAITEQVASTDADVAAAIDLRESIVRMPARDRKVCECLARGLTERETAVVVGTTHTTVKVAKKRIQEHLADSQLDGVPA
jgi:DNA-directed RNA polymerase specialized sigma24 family protein